MMGRGVQQQRAQEPGPVGVGMGGATCVPVHTGQMAPAPIYQVLKEGTAAAAVMPPHNIYHPLQDRPVEGHAFATPPQQVAQVGQVGHTQQMHAPHVPFAQPQYGQQQHYVVAPLHPLPGPQTSVAPPLAPGQHIVPHLVMQVPPQQHMGAVYHAPVNVVYPQAYGGQMQQQSPPGVSLTPPTCSLPAMQQAPPTYSTQSVVSEQQATPPQPSYPLPSPQEECVGQGAMPVLPVEQASAGQSSDSTTRRVMTHQPYSWEEDIYAGSLSTGSTRSLHSREAASDRSNATPVRDDEDFDDHLAETSSVVTVAAAVAASSADEMGQVKAEHGAYPCRDFTKGVCRRGKDCRFAHVGASDEQAVQQGSACKDFRRGKCMRRHCRFLHVKGKAVSSAMPAAATDSKLSSTLSSEPKESLDSDDCQQAVAPRARRTRKRRAKPEAALVQANDEP